MSQVDRLRCGVERGKCLMPHSKVAMKGLGKEKKRLCCLTYQLFHTDGGVTEYGRKHTKTHTHTHTHLSYSLSLWGFRSSRSLVFCKIGALKNFPKFTEKGLCQSFLFNEVAAETPAQVFPVNFEKFLRTSLFTEHPQVTAS